MTESDWQGDMLRRMADESSGDTAGPAQDPVVPEQPPAAPPPQDPQQYAPPAPPGQVAPYQPAPYEQYPPPAAYQDLPQQPEPYQEPQYPPYHQQPPGQIPYQVPQQQYPPQQYPPPPPPPPYQQYPPPPYQPPPEYYQQPPPPPQQQPWGPPPPTPPGDGGWGPPPPQYEAFNPNAPVEPGVDQPGDSDSVFKRFRRIASEAAYLVGASGRMQRDVDNIAIIRRPIAIMRRVGVLSPVTQSGTSTVTALLALTLAAQRSDRVVALDADPNEAELSRRLELTIGAGPVEPLGLVQAEPTAEGVRTKLAEVQGSGARDVSLAIVDCPGTMFDEISSAMASTGHATVLVVPSVQHVAQYALAQLDQLTPQGQDMLLTRGVVVISLSVDVDPESVSWLVEAFRQRGLDPIVLPYDPHVAMSWPLRSEEFQQETRRALLDLAARVVETVTRTT